MLKYIAIFFLLSITLFAEVLKDTYFIDNKDIRVSTFTSNPQDSTIIATIDESRNKKSISSKEILSALKVHGYNNFTTNSNYITFIQKSDIALDELKDKLMEYFLENYPYMEIKKVELTPRGYIKALPDEYDFEMPSPLSNSGVIHILTPQKMKYFFDFYIDGYIDVYVAKSSIKRGEALSEQNIIKKHIKLEKLKDAPLNSFEDNKLESKKQLAKDTILYKNDVTQKRVVKKGSMVNASYDEDGIDITFGAKALQDGKLNDIISIQNSSNKIIKARVIGENMVIVE